MTPVKWHVEVREIGTDDLEHSVACRSEREAEKVQAGMNINLDHKRFYTVVVEGGKE